MQGRNNEVWVGLFMLISFGAMLFLCLKVANITSLTYQPTWRLYATFNNVGGLKPGSPVKIGGVVIGRVADISLDEKSYSPQVALDIQQRYNRIPDTSSLAIRTSGLLGEQYLSLNIGFEDPAMDTHLLKEGDRLQDTKSALVLEDLIGQLIYKSTGQHNATPPQ